MVEKEGLTVSYQKLGKAVKAVTGKYECGFCSSEFSSETRACFHVIKRHI